MEAIIKKKSNAIEQLVGTTSQMLDSLDSGRVDEIDKQLQDRVSLFSDLEYFDSLIKDRPTDRDSAWIKQLRWIKDKDQEIHQKLEIELNKVTQSLRQGQQEKLHLMNQELLEAKGNRVSTKA